MTEIETFENPAIGRKYEINHINNEFTSVCPITGLPDFAKVHLRYIPDKICIELKSLKYYYFDYRDKGIFYEEITNKILDDLKDVCDPLEMEITTEWTVRGGIHSIIKAKHVKGE